MPVSGRRSEPTGRSDEELFAAYVGGEQAAFRALFDRYAGLLTRVLSRRVNSAAEVHDLVQQTFLQVHRARHDFRADGKLRPWLMAIGLNVMRRHFRSTFRAREVALQQASNGTPLNAPALTVSLDPVAAEQRRQLHAALERLSEGQRQAIELHWLEGFSFPEVAEIVGASVSAVKVRAHRGYAILRDLLDDQHVTESESGAS